MNTNPDRDTLRQHIAEALDNANRTHPCPVTGSQYWTGCYHPDGTSSSCHTNRRTDAVLAVLPDLVDRAAADAPFGSPDCTCIPFTQQTDPPRYLNRPTDTVDMISGWEPGRDCPHHAPTADRAAEAHRLALSEALDLGTGAPWEAIHDRVKELRRLAAEAPTTTKPETETVCVCGHPIRQHFEDTCLLTGCGCADALEISALPEALEAVLTKRFTELGNPFSAMRRQEQGPDGWPASHPVGPHHVADALRELLAAGVGQDGAQPQEEHRG